MRLLQMFAALSALATVLLLIGCDANSQESGRVIYQSVAAVQVHEREEYALTRGFTGVVLPARSAELAFEFSGTVQIMMVDEGDRVAEGDLLAQLDTALLAIERRQLQAQLLEAQANLRLSQANLARHQTLESDGFASQQRRDELEASHDAVAASIDQFLAALDGNEVRQQKAHIYAPFAGVVGERYLEEGSSAGAGRPVLRMLETGQMEAHVGVPRQLAGVLQVGQLVSVQIGDDTLEGQVLAVGAELKQRSHTAKVRIKLPSQPLFSGSLVELQLEDAIATAGYMLPQSALTASLRGLWRVFVLVPAGDGLYRVEARDLQLRYSGEQHAYVEGGLSDGEMVVTEGVHKIVPGQLVRVVEAELSS
jgi:RND family efflux transporter MFP subunit